MWKNKKSQAVILWFVVAALAISVTFLTSPKPASAQAPTPFLASPYNGQPGDGISQRFTATHDGIDFLLRWTTVQAAADGVVDRAQWNNLNCHDETQCSGTDSGFGLYVRIRHDLSDPAHPYYTYYGHLSIARTVLGTVRKGEWIGTAGDSGYTISDTNPPNPHAPHLHFEVRHGCATAGRPPAGCAVNPDNENGISLWTEGEWSGANPANSVPEWRFPTYSSYGAETIVDDTPDNSGGFTRGRNISVACAPEPDPNCPYWHRITTDGYNGDYYWTLDNNYTVNYWAEWRPNLPAFGNYRVFVIFPCIDGDVNYVSWGAPYHIQRFDAGTPMIVDQRTLTTYDAEAFRSGCNRWVNIGVYLSQSGTSTVVRLTDATGETGFNRLVIADAIRFVRVNVGPFENENFRINNSPRSSHSWTLGNSVGGYVGTGYMEATPNNGANLGDLSGPELQYKVVFPTAGTYYVWVRGRGGPTCCTVNTDDDSLWFGRNGSLVERMAGWENGTAWLWKNRKGYQDPTRITVNIPTPGLHTINIWMREDGLRVDQALFSQDSGFTP